MLSEFVLRSVLGDSRRQILIRTLLAGPAIELLKKMEWLGSDRGNLDAKEPHHSKKQRPRKSMYSAQKNEDCNPRQKLTSRSAGNQQINRKNYPRLSQLLGEIEHQKQVFHQIISLLERFETRTAILRLVELDLRLHKLLLFENTACHQEVV